jgi:hypothetical protein
LHPSDKVKKSEDGDFVNSCQTCGGENMPLGVLGNLSHNVCRNCGVHTSTPVEENTESMEDGDPTVAKAEGCLPDGSGFATGTVKKAENGVQRERGIKQFGNVRPPVTPAMTAVEMRRKDRPKVKGGVQSQIAAKLGKEELSSVKEVAPDKLVLPKKANGAKDGSEKVPAAKETDGSGTIKKGAMVDHIKQSAAKAGVPVKSILGYKPPKTLQSVTPTPTPNFGSKKPLIPMVNTGGVVAKAESPAAKPIAKSPSSAPAGKTAAPKQSGNLTPKVSKL